MKTHSLERLYRQRKDNKWQICEISISQEENEPLKPAFIFTLHGIEDGKQQTDTKVITEGKNIGKSNETTIWDQAISEAESKWNKKSDEGYNTTKVSKADASFLPQLAYEYNDRISSVFRAMKKAKAKSVTIDIQPKLDGVRAFVREVNKKPQMFTRKGKNVSTVIPHILKQLSKLEPGLVADGEVYSIEGNIQAIAGAMNKKEYDADRHADLIFVIFDAYVEAEPGLSFPERLNRIRKYADGVNVIMIDQYDFAMGVCQRHTVSSEGQLTPLVLRAHRDAVDQGFEGVMVRSTASPYVVQKRDISLLKFKQFFDEEYKIVDIITPKTGRDKGTAIYVCETQDKQQFNCSPFGTVEERKLIYETRDQHIGKMLSVQYQDLTDDGKPRFPKGIAIRDYE